MVKGMKHTEIGLVPTDWETVNIAGNSTLKARIGWQGLTTAEYLSQGEYFLVTGTDFKDGRINWDNCFYVSEHRYKQDKNIQIQNEDILITKDGTIGKVAYVDNIKTPATLNSGVFVIRPKDNSYIPKFLFYVFRSFYFKTFLQRLSAGSTINHLYQKDFVDFNFPLPKEKTEQKAIAQVLNDIDALINSLEKLIIKKKAIKLGTMQTLLKPKKGWMHEKLGEKSDIFRGGSPRPIENFITREHSGINWIKIGDVGVSAKYIESTAEKIKPSGISNSRFVNEGDFLLSNSMSFGRPYILKTSGCIHDGWLVIQNYKNTFDQDFLYYILGFETTLNQYKKMAAGSTVLNLNKEIVNQVQINYPKDKKEQKRIAQILSDMDEEILVLENKLKKKKQLKQGVMQVLLTGKIRLI